MIKEFIASPELKYAVITKEAWLNDEIAQTISKVPREFVFNGVDLIILSISKNEVLKLYNYVEGHVEFNQINLGTGKVTLLLKSELTEVLPIEAD